MVAAVAARIPGRVRSAGRVFAAALLLFLPALLLPSSLRAAEPPGAATPEALVARLRAAAQHDDLAEVANCTAPEQRVVWAAAMLRKGKMMMQFFDSGAGAAPAAANAATPAQQIEAFKARQERIAQPAELQAFHQAILEKHGIAARLAKEGPPANDAAAAELLAGVDQGALIADMTALVDSLLDPSRREHPKYFPDEDVGPFQVKGDHATAKCGGCQLELVRVDGRWYQLLPPKD